MRPKLVRRWVGIVRVKQKRGRKEDGREVTYLHECIFLMRGMVSSQTWINFKAGKNLFSNFLQIFVEVLLGISTSAWPSLRVLWKKSLCADQQPSYNRLSYSARICTGPHGRVSQSAELTSDQPGMGTATPAGKSRELHRIHFPAGLFQNQLIIPLKYMLIITNCFPFNAELWNT